MHLHVPFGDLKRQHDTIRAELDAAVTRVIDSGWYILGPEVCAFEEAFAAFCAARYCIGVANGTEALQLALTALGVGPGDEVITVANASVYQAITIMAVGARPVFVDVDERSHTMDPAALAAAITPRTRAIMPVHLYGRMADMDAIMAVPTATAFRSSKTALRRMGRPGVESLPVASAHWGASVSTPPRTSVLLAMAARSPQTTRRWRRRFGGCGSMAGNANTIPATQGDSTRASMNFRRRS
jgi:Predicted pyridoxal phosphate-dependent enzyme apparently involved in regulation of cell wall biogenesis